MKIDPTSPLNLVCNVLSGNAPEVIQSPTSEPPPAGARLLGVADDLSKMISGNMSFNETAANNTMHRLESKFLNQSLELKHLVDMKNGCGRKIAADILSKIFWESVFFSIPSCSRVIGKFAVYRDWQVVVDGKEVIDLPTPVFRAGTLPDRFFQTLLSICKGSHPYDGVGDFGAVEYGEEVIGTIDDGRVQQLHYLNMKLVDAIRKHDPYETSVQEYFAFSTKPTLEYIAFRHGLYRLRSMQKMTETLFRMGFMDGLAGTISPEALASLLMRQTWDFDIKGDWQIVLRSQVP